MNYLLIRGSGPGPLFRFQDGKPLTRARLVDQVREALHRAGIDGALYSGHSFRSGAATTAAKVGVEDSAIKILGSWQSRAYQLYIKTPRHQLAADSKQLAGPSKEIQGNMQYVLHHTSSSNAHKHHSLHSLLSLLRSYSDQKKNFLIKKKKKKNYYCNYGRLIGV